MKETQQGPKKSDAAIKHRQEDAASRDFVSQRDADVEESAAKAKKQKQKQKVSDG
ncbi:MAG: hypothetical protein ABI386_02420 [Rhodanobacter sp.]